MFSSKLFLIPVTLQFFLLSCSSNSESNGACEWHQRKFSATVTEIKFDKLSNKGDSLFQVKLMFDAGSLSEKEQDLGNIKDMEITKAKLTRNKIKVNATYTGTISDLKEGNCATPVVAFDQRLN